MTITLEATYEKGHLKFKEPLALAEGTTVRVTIASLNEDDPFADIIGICHSGRRDGAAHHDRYLKRKRAR
jgi:predicted DNA-binding antitoxin AbrB/MazE fold protein